MRFVAKKPGVSGVKIFLSEGEYRDFLNQSIGICMECGELRDMCEPDARQYKCDVCGALRAYGVEVLMMSNVICVTEKGRRANESLRLCLAGHGVPVGSLGLV